MMPLNGNFISYGDFRKNFGEHSSAPIAWGWDDLKEALGSSFGKDMAGLGLLTLSRDATPSGCEIAPGLSFTIQSLQTGYSTPEHAHAWWHIIIVLSGAGHMKFTNSIEEKHLVCNDIVFIPAWCKHSIHNSNTENFTMLNLTNMIQQAELFNLTSS